MKKKIIFRYQASWWYLWELSFVHIFVFTNGTASTVPHHHQHVSNCFYSTWLFRRSEIMQFFWRAGKTDTFNLDGMILFIFLCSLMKLLPLFPHHLQHFSNCFNSTWLFRRSEIMQLVWRSQKTHTFNIEGMTLLLSM